MLNESESGTDESKYCESDKDAFPFWKSAITTRPSVGAVTFHATTVHPMTSAQVTMLHSTTWSGWPDGLSKKWPYGYKSRLKWPRQFSQEKWKILSPLKNCQNTWAKKTEHADFKKLPLGTNDTWFSSLLWTRHSPWSNHHGHVQGYLDSHTWF